MSGTVVVNCKCCKQPFTARVADRKRGWARFCSKSCKASQQVASGMHFDWSGADKDGDRSEVHRFVDEDITFSGRPA